MTGPRLRSQAWLAGDDEVALEHRVALRSAGLDIGTPADRPVIGIANSASDLNPCNLPLRDLAVEVKTGIEEAGGVGAEFGTISLGEDLMKPSAMLYRNLLAIEIEEMVRANPLDGLVVLANCDKSVPGALMGAISANVPTVLVTGGSRPVAQFRGTPVGTGTALWRMWDERRAGRLDDIGWAEFERCLSCGRGACNTMGTASTMAVLAEVLGLMVPGAASIPSGEKRGLAAARTAGQLAVSAVLADLRPQSILTEDSFANAIIALNAIGGSTNAVIHLAAMAGRAGVPFALDGHQPARRHGSAAGRHRAIRVGPDAGLRQGGRRSDPAARARGQLRTSALTVSGRSIGQLADDAAAASWGNQAGERSAARGWRVRRRARLAGARRGGHQDLGGDAGIAAPSRTSSGLSWLRRHAGPDRRPVAADYPADRTGAGGMRSGRRPWHAGMGDDPDPGAAGQGRGNRHGPGH